MAAPRRAVIGSGIAGLAAAHVLSTRGPVTLYEADARLGGHADTHEVQVDGHFYLEYSRAGFRSGYLDVQQLVLEREGAG